MKKKDVRSRHDMLYFASSLFETPNFNYGVPTPHTLPPTPFSLNNSEPKVGRINIGLS